MKRDPDYLQFRPYRAIVATPVKGRPAPIAGGKSNLVDFPVRGTPGPRPRSRVLYLFLAVAVIVVGLLWRSSLVSFTPFLTKYGGSAWWSLLVFLCCGIVAPRAATWVVTIAALVLAFGVEFSQLYHASWIDHIREYELGALVLGSTFSGYDLIAYAVGILSGATLEAILRRRSAGRGS